MLRLNIQKNPRRPPPLMIPTAAQLRRRITALVDDVQRVAHFVARHKRLVRHVFVLHADPHGAVVEPAVGPGVEAVVWVGWGVEVFGEGSDVHGVDEAFAVEAAVALFAAGGDDADEEEGEEGEEDGG